MQAPSSPPAAEGARGLFPDFCGSFMVSLPTTSTLFPARVCVSGLILYHSGDDWRCLSRLPPFPAAKGPPLPHSVSSEFCFLRMERSQLSSRHCRGAGGRGMPRAGLGESLTSGVQEAGLCYSGGSRGWGEDGQPAQRMSRRGHPWV